MQNIPYQGPAYHVQLLTWRFMGNNWEFICERDNKQKNLSQVSSILIDYVLDIIFF